MSSLCVYNSLLRIDGQSGVPPIPYECPNQNLDLWVLELPSNNQDVSYWSSEVSKILENQAVFLQTKKDKGCNITLFVETNGKLGVFSLHHSFIKLLVRMEISLEYYAVITSP